MAMKEHLHIHKKTGFQSASTPQRSQFQSRPFVVQPQTEEQSEQPDIKTALERAKRYGHSLDRIKFSETRVQRPEPRIVQAKLTIGEPGDRYEQEADSVAASVVQQINAPDPQQSTQSQSVQREATPDEKDELMKKPDISAIQRQEEQEEEIQAKPEITALQRQEEPEEEIQAKPNVSDLMRSPLPTQVQREAMPEDEELQTKSILQRREAIGGGEASTDVESAINSARGGGQPLDEGLQRSMGQAMGADFSGVKVHTDAQADRLNRSVQARAFTTGQDVFFRSGEYNPASRGGQELIAHELTHVVQQSGGVVQRVQPQIAKGEESEEQKENKPRMERFEIGDLKGHADILKSYIKLSDFSNTVDKFIMNAHEFGFTYSKVFELISGMTQWAKFKNTRAFAEQAVTQLSKATNKNKFNEIYAEVIIAIHRQREAGYVAEQERVYKPGLVILNAIKGKNYDLGGNENITIDPVEEADALFHGYDGKIHLEEIKATLQALFDKIRTTPQQFNRMIEWKDNDSENRTITIRVHQAADEDSWQQLLKIERYSQVITTLREYLSNGNIMIGDKEITTDFLDRLVQKFEKQSVSS